MAANLKEIGEKKRGSQLSVPVSSGESSHEISKVGNRSEGKKKKDIWNKTYCDSFLQGFAGGYLFLGQDRWSE